MTWTRVNKHWCGEELDELQARLHMQARKVMREGRWVDPREAVVVYRRTHPETEGGTP